MSKPSVQKLPHLERRLMLDAFRNVVNAHPQLAHVRLLLRAPADRQLALLAALERSATRGTPLTHPPHPDDHADALLCDILDALDRDPSTGNYGAYHGPLRHLVNLQALGIWNGDQPANRPTALDLFTTRFADLTAEPASHLRPAAPINSPLSQDSSPGGELIAAPTADQTPASTTGDSPQVVDLLLVTSGQPPRAAAPAPALPLALIHHQAPESGELPSSIAGSTSTASPAPLPSSSRAASAPRPADSAAATDASVAGELVPSRPVRRGRPLLLDERAKGRVLGLMAYGLSLRQAAAQLGLHHTTILAALSRDEEFAAQVSEARLDAIAQPLITVVQASRRSWRAAAWLAKYLQDRNNTPAASEASAD